MLHYLLVILIAVTTSAIAEAAPGDNWHYSDITKLLETRASQGKPLRSVDEFLQVIPEGLRRNFTFVYATKNKFQDASPLHPRTLAFNNNLIFTFNGHPNQKGFQTIELMEFDYASKRLELREIDFTKLDAQGLADFSTTTPHKCMECHGQDPKPIWQEYRIWRGVYGSRDDVVLAEELPLYKTFLKSVNDDPKSRYRNLVFPKGSDLSPYTPSGSNGPMATDFRINLLLSKLLNRFNSIRSARIAKASPYFESYKYVLALYLDTLYRCYPDQGLELKLRAQLDGLIRARNLRVPPKAYTLDKLMTVLGLPIHRFTTDPFAARGFLFQDGAKKQITLMGNIILQDITKDDPSFSDVNFSTTDNFNSYPVNSLYRHIDSLVPLVSNMQDPGLCKLMNNKALKQIANVKLPDVSESEHAFEDKLRIAEEVRADAAIPVSCVYCHVVQGEAAPSIAFDNADLVGKHLRENGGRLLSEIRRRTKLGASPDAIMPPLHHPDFAELSKDQAEDLLRYLSGL